MVGPSGFKRGLVSNGGSSDCGGLDTMELGFASYFQNMHVSTPCPIVTCDLISERARCASLFAWYRPGEAVASIQVRLSMPPVKAVTEPVQIIISKVLEV